MFQHKKYINSRNFELISEEDDRILGSGNFAVLKGGTFRRVGNHQRQKRYG